MLLSAVINYLFSSTTSVKRFINVLKNSFIDTMFFPVIHTVRRNNYIKNFFKLFYHCSSIIRQSNIGRKLLGDSRSKSRFTHFISIPINSEEIKSKFLSFKKDILNNCGTEIDNFSEDMFQKPEKLHLTICMLHLFDEYEQQRAIETLYVCKKKFIDPVLNKNKPLILKFKGLKCMEKNISQARVVYADVKEETGILLKMVKEIIYYFIQQGFSRNNNDKVILHMTVINNVFYKRKNKHQKLPNHFDATTILRDYGNVFLGEMNLSTLHLSSLKKKSPDGYYEATAKIHF